MRRRSKPAGGRLFLWVVGGPPKKDADDPQIETLRFLRRFFVRVYMPVSLIYVAVAVTAESTYWLPAIAVLVIGTGAALFLTFRIRPSGSLKVLAATLPSDG
jgi:hypothetical protein